ncbi:ATP-dependent sacrificial sulfur transferase LarE [Candidatus Magnetomonas plexicatena]|uniref:ATP-dependent sacrificial sulfur transferase LarE n=1 Tax=Candidatus Magnetomonas plexicatena TaxID=2552947 RepID=UPI001C7648ED|nr:ATP-dependent sacrificial sulfur transferase LarE [Nitrospirales bacterium LBB_01]
MIQKPDSDSIDKKYITLVSYLKSLNSVVLAYSGGVDSTFLLKALSDAQISALAVTAKSPSMPIDDFNRCVSMTEKFNIPTRIIETDEMRDERYAANTHERCFYCKSELFGKLTAIAETEGYECVIDGSNADDLSDYRPGFKAKERFMVKSPLIEVGMSKADIRELSQRFGLSTWDKPSSPCLASRLPYGERVTEEALTMVSEAERALKTLGFGELRVRKHGDTARIELNADDIEKCTQGEMRKEIVQRLKAIGFLYVLCDLEGYVSGKLNRVLKRSEQ